MTAADSKRLRVQPPLVRVVLVVALAVLFPLALLIAWPSLGPPSLPLHVSPVSQFPVAEWPFHKQVLGRGPQFRPRITHVRIVDLDQDGRPDILASDAQHKRVFWYRSVGPRQWQEIPLGGELNVPAGLAVVDLDGDGDLDVVVAVLGSVLPADDRIGQVVWLENRGTEFVDHIVLDHLRRVSDVQAADFNGDGRPDLAVAVYGYHHGEVLWLENRGSGRFREHRLLATQGPSHVPVADFTGDGRPDIGVLVSQDHEEVWLFANQGNGRFTPRLIFQTCNFDLGSASLRLADLDADGRPDLLLCAGDNLEINHHYPQPWHGCIWLRNKGAGEFETIRLAAVGGVYGAAVADLTGDGLPDVVLCCMFNDWRTAAAASLVLLENQGHQQFTPRTLDTLPIHLAVIDAGDLDGDGRADIVAGGLHLDDLAPQRWGRLTLWLHTLPRP
ncbi:MAG: VCBS repeat-containing protein [Gemmataceae bacterium]|nr:VCBS repeat-containing protein [Gemmataceae bacterium]MCS7269766.1 VCBS repeat-containing protein [Gemmataceae bacterium]MDW8243589.1 VCBS repeat-containing protein [Thermogemmata sp.]